LVRPLIAGDTRKNDRLAIVQEMLNAAGFAKLQ
jgi:hypothetical protein